MTDIDRYYAEGPLPETANPEPADPWTETRVVGKPLPRIDAYERVSGTAVYPFDVTLPDMLHAAVLRCPHAHAMVTRVDVGAAEEMPGVRAVITHETHPDVVYGSGSIAGDIEALAGALAPGAAHAADPITLKPWRKWPST